MRIRPDNILLGILWLLAVTLGTCFWFNTVFGFDIFSAQHWEYISELQAARTPIKSGFYVSMAIAIFITILGLYIIVRPRTRRIRLPIIKTNKNNSDKNSTETPRVQTDAKNNTNNNDASTLDILPSMPKPTQIPQDKNSTSPSSAARPPRLNVPTWNANQNTALHTITPTMAQNIAPKQQNNNTDELRQIFANAGYTVKNNARIGSIQTSLIAIGTNETMWLGCVGVKTTDVRAIIDKFQQIFSDTLDETYIGINGFVIAAPDAATSEFEDILMFNSTDELRAYIQQNPNPPLAGDDDGMFDAYSEYIDAVITHIGKI